jgi:signal transduction histidine kinase/ligand-binding sensor domain-containing protein
MLRPKIVLALAVWLALAAPALFALNPHKTLAQYSHSVWTEADGLSGDGVRAIAQTTDGYLWIGTNEGLSRFDGYEFTTFSEDDGSLLSSSVESLAASRDGTLWIGTPDGLTRYRNGRFTTFTTKDGLPDNSITALLEDHDGSLWIVAGAHLSRLQDGKFINYSADRMLPLQTPRLVYEGPHNTVWIAGIGGLVKFVRGEFVQVLKVREMGGRIVNSVVEDADGRLWIGGTKGILVRTPGGEFTKLDARDGLPDSLVVTLHRDREANLWAGTNNGLSRFDKGRFVASDFARGQNHNFRCLFEDREGDLWVGMNSGLNRLRDDRFTVFGRTEGFPSDEPVAVQQGKNGTVWIGYHNAGLVALRNGRIQVYTTKNGMASNEIFSIRERHSGDLLLSTREGLTVMHDGRFSNRVPPDLINRTVVLDALEDHKRQLWLATPGGAYQEVDGEFRTIVPGGPVPIEGAVVLCEGLDGSIWVGFNGRGLWRIQDGKTTHYRVAEGLGSDTIRALYPDPDGALWIGTIGGGLNEFRNGTFSRYTVKDGLLSNNISHIEDDGQGSLWLSTSRGICRIAKDQLRGFSSGRLRTLNPVNYGVADGLRSTQVGTGGTKTGDGRLWFPTTNGLAMFDPRAENEDRRLAPEIGLVEITVDGHDIDVRHPATLKPGPGHVQFRYAAIHLHSPERVRYEYKLEGLDPDWIPATTRRTVDYNSLKHGRYRFLVRASVPGQAPGEASFDLNILPHVYERNYFLWVCLVTLIASIWGVYQLRLRQVRLRFSLVLDERARMAREIHDTMAQSFVGISSQLDAVAMRMQSDYNVATRHLDLAQKMARHSLTEARRAVMDLRASPLEGRDLPSALAIAADQWTANGAIPVEIDVSGTFGRPPHDRIPQEMEQNVLRIAQEAVTNAVKHARPSRIWIRLIRGAETLALTVRDDGCGFSSGGFVEGIADGHFGLLGMRKRAERHGGDLIISSRPGTGTTVEMSLPLPPNHLTVEIVPPRHPRSLLNLIRMRFRSARS